MSNDIEYENHNENNEYNLNTDAFIHSNQALNCSESAFHYLSVSSTSYSNATIFNNDLIVNKYHANITNTNVFETMNISTNTNAPSPTNIIKQSKSNVRNAAVYGSHQRRGSLQLWQFLVALLDESISR